LKVEYEIGHEACINAENPQSFIDKDGKRDKVDQKQEDRDPFIKDIAFTYKLGCVMPGINCLKDHL